MLTPMTCLGWLLSNVIPASCFLSAAIAGCSAWSAADASPPPPCELLLATGPILTWHPAIRAIASAPASFHCLPTIRLLLDAVPDDCQPPRMNPLKIHRMHRGGNRRAAPPPFGFHQIRSSFRSS